MFITIRFINLIFIILTFSVLSTLSVVVPGADTPLFYSVSTSGSSANNLLPLRINGGTGGFATLTGSGPIGQLYFNQGKLVVQDPAGSTNTYKPYISAAPDVSGCTDFGPLGFVQGSSSNKCALFENFQIQSDTENSQLGAKLVFNYQGGFFVCGASQDIWYKASPDQGPSDCSSIDLYTIPVIT
jgi:hypothetical protein